MPDEFGLTEDQQKAVLQCWNNAPKEHPLRIIDIVKAVFGDAYDARSKEGRMVKSFLASRQLAVSQVKAEDVVLQDEDKEFIENHCTTMTPVEMARVVFKNDRLTGVTKEAQVIAEFCKTLTTKTYGDLKDVVDGEYKSPKSIDRVIARVNEYQHYSINKDKLTPNQKKELYSLIGYLNSYRFKHTINNYTNQRDRDLLEATFISYTFNKADLIPEEVDTYIILSQEAVISSNIQKHIETLQTLLDEKTQSGDEKIAMSLVSAITSAREEHNECVKRQQSLLKDLIIKRSERLSKQVQENASVLNLVHVPN